MAYRLTPLLGEYRRTPLLGMTNAAFLRQARVPILPTRPPVSAPWIPTPIPPVVSSPTQIVVSAPAPVAMPMIQPMQPTVFTQAPVEALPSAPQVPVQPGSSPSAPAPAPTPSSSGGGGGGAFAPIPEPSPAGAPLATQDGMGWLLPVAAIAGLVFFMSRRN